MTKIIGIAGSLRRASLNAALLRAAAERAPAGTDVEIASIAGIPLYDGDLESERGVPDAVTRSRIGSPTPTRSCSSRPSTTTPCRASSRTPSTG